MPLWKKAKCTRISKLVVDHLHSPKRGGSLVVETGFPTSLIDLFVKNRDRLKKPSKKKKFEANPDPIPTSRPSLSSSTLGTPWSSGLPNSPLIPTLSATMAEPSSSRPSNSGGPRPRVSDFGYATPQRCSSGRFGNEIAEIRDSGVIGDGKDGGGDDIVEANGIFVAILKMFFVVVLALGTKKFVVGITMSAFLLLFMEYAGKHLSGLLKPCADAHISLVERGLCFVGIKRNKLIIKEDKGSKAPIAQEGATPVVSDCFGLIEGHNIHDPIQEIQIAQPNSNFSHSLIEGHKMNDPFQEIQVGQPSPNLVPPIGEIQSVKYEFDLRSGQEKWEHEEMGKKEEVMEKEEAYSSGVVDLKSQRTHSGKIRSKIKKIIFKKLGGSKKKRKGFKNEASSSSGDNETVMNEAKEHLEGGGRCGLEGNDRSLSLSSGENVDQVDLVDRTCSSSELSRPDMEDNIDREDDGTETEKNSGHLILIVIVLVGLVWGRGFAVSLALSWYLLLKSVGTLQKLIKGSRGEVPMSS